MQVNSPDIYRQCYPYIKQLLENRDDVENVTITALGRSMEPFFESLRDTLKLEKCEKAKVNDFVLALTEDGRFIAHRVVAADSEKFTMRGDGNVYGTEQALHKNIIGRITAYRRRGKKKFHSMNSWKWRLYTKLWPANPLARRILLAFHHHVYLKLLWLAFRPEWMIMEKNINRK